MTALIQNTAELRSFNTKRIIEYSRCHEGITKKNLTSALDLSFATVSNICNQLTEEGILRESGTNSSSGGRVAKVLTLDYRSRLAICVDILRHGNYSVSITDLTGKELCREGVAVDVGLSIDGLVERLYGDSLSMLKRMDRSLDSVLGIAVAAPGIFNSESGAIINSTNPLFENKPLKAMLNTRFNLPVYIENESNLLATAASRSGNGGQIFRDLVYLYIGDGVGVGVISKGLLITGSRGLGGEIEHLPIGTHHFECYCGNSDCVEPELIESGFLEKWVTSGAGKRGAPQWPEFLSSVKAAQPEALAVVRENGRLIGKMLSILVNIFDPEIVYVSGIVGDFFELIEPEISTEMNSRMVARDYRSVPVVCDVDYHSMMLTGCTELVFDGWRL